MKYFLAILLLSIPALGGKPQGQILFESFTYDFSTSSATSATPHSLTTLPAGAVVRNVYLTTTTPVSPSAMSIDIGPNSDPDGFLGTLTGSSTASSTAISAASNDSPLLWDGSNDHLIPWVVVNPATDGVVEIQFDNDPTQGKIEVHIEYFIPKNAQ